MTIVASRQIFGWYPARIRTSKREWKYSGIAAYAILRHSNPSPSGPGALLDEEDMMAFRISLCVARGHGKRRVGVVGSGSRLAVVVGRVPFGRVLLFLQKFLLLLLVGLYLGWGLFSLVWCIAWL